MEFIRTKPYLFHMERDVDLKKGGFGFFVTFETADAHVTFLFQNTDKFTGK